MFAGPGGGHTFHVGRAGWHATRSSGGGCHALCVVGSVCHALHAGTVGRYATYPGGGGGMPYVSYRRSLRSCSVCLKRWRACDTFKLWWMAYSCMLERLNGMQ